MIKNSYPGVKFVFFLTVSLLLASCGGTTYVNASHTRHHVKDKVLPLVAGKSVSLKNYYSSASPVTLSEQADSTKLVGDLQQYTNVTLNIFKAELIKRDVFVADTHFKSITLKISDVQATNKLFDKSTSLKLTARLGNGKSTSISANYQTGGSAAQALDGAIITAITQLLKSELVTGYINQ